MGMERRSGCCRFRGENDGERQMLRRERKHREANEGRGDLERDGRRRSQVSVNDCPHSTPKIHADTRVLEIALLLEVRWW